MSAVLFPRHCRACACTELDACLAPWPCSWAGPDLCSACADAPPAVEFNVGDRVTCLIPCWGEDDDCEIATLPAGVEATVVPTYGGPGTVSILFANGVTNVFDPWELGLLAKVPAQGIAL